MMRFVSPDQLRENLGIAVDALRTNKLRSGLTILGVVIGVATVMTMATIVKGIRDQILTTISIAGPTTFYVMKIFSSTPINPDQLPKYVRVRSATPACARATCWCTAPTTGIRRRSAASSWPAGGSPRPSCGAARRSWCCRSAMRGRCSDVWRLRARHLRTDLAAIRDRDSEFAPAHHTTRCPG